MTKDFDSNALLVTAVVPTYCRSRLLKRAVQSVLDQENVPLQICVYDNASDDDTGDVIASLSQQDARIRYHRHPRNIGGAANFDFGLRRVTTPFFSILSDDDYLIPGFYSRALDDLSRHPEAMFWAGITLNVDNVGNIWDARVDHWPREGLFAPPEGLMRIFHGMHPAWTGILFRREVLELVGFPDQETLGPTDLDFTLRIASHYPYLLYKVPSAVVTLNPSSFSATQPLSSFWPGWEKMFRNLEQVDSLDDLHRNMALSALRADGRRMLFRRAANAIAQGRYDFSGQAADALLKNYNDTVAAGLIRLITWICRHNRISGQLYAALYRFVERRLVRSRWDRLRQYRTYIRPA